MTSDELRRLLLEEISPSIAQAWRETAAIEEEIRIIDEQIADDRDVRLRIEKENATKEAEIARLKRELAQIKGISFPS